MSERRELMVRSEASLRSTRVAEDRCRDLERRKSEMEEERHSLEAELRRLRGEIEQRESKTAESFWQRTVAADREKTRLENALDQAEARVRLFFFSERNVSRGGGEGRGGWWMVDVRCFVKVWGYWFRVLACARLVGIGCVCLLFWLCLPHLVRAGWSLQRVREKETDQCNKLDKLEHNSFAPQSRRSPSLPISNSSCVLTHPLRAISTAPYSTHVEIHRVLCISSYRRRVAHRPLVSAHLIIPFLVTPHFWGGMFGVLCTRLTSTRVFLFAPTALARWSP